MTSETRDRDRRREGEDKPEGDDLTEEQKLQQEHAKETADVMADDKPAAEAEPEPEPEAPARRTAKDKAEDEKTPAA